jgi:hypothetical protein
VPLAGLLAAGAGPELARDLLVFPLTHFRHVRPELFPLLPRIGDRPWLENARAATYWASLHLPSLALLAGTAALWPRRGQLPPAARFGLRFAWLLYALVWWAAHVQINTHLVTLTGLGAWLAAAGLGPAARGGRRRATGAALAAAALWGLVLLAEPGERLRRDWRGGSVATRLAGLRGIRVSRADAAWMRRVSEAIGRAAPPGAPLQLVGRRNDVLIYASPQLYWLARRPFATRYHELHPGITDTDAVQLEMLAGLAREPAPVIVRETRFDDARLEAAKREFLAAGVPVGATRLDAWIARHYRSRTRAGIYEVMERGG